MGIQTTAKFDARIRREIQMGLTGVIFGAGSFSFDLYCWPLGEAAAAAGGVTLARRLVEAVGGALGRRVVEAVGGALGRRVVEAVGGALGRRVVEAVGEALGRRVVEAVGEALARRVVEAVGEALARRVAVGEEPGVLRGRPSEPAAGQELYVQPGAEGPAYAGPAAAAF
jgi:hypothetical protein